MKKIDLLQSEIIKCEMVCGGCGMRKMLFRGKRIDTGAWVQGYYFKVWDEHYICWGTTNGEVDKLLVIPETVGQDTGLKDKNGKKIFEGDVVKAEHDNYYNPEHEDEPEYSAWIGSIEYEEGYYKINTNCEYCPAINNIRIKTIEIIGNVHDNPELVED